MEQTTEAIIETSTQVLTENENILQSLTNIEIFLDAIVSLLLIIVIYGLGKALYKFFNSFF